MSVVSEATTGATLLERATELRAIDHALAQAKRGAGSLIVIGGQAGIGKSTIVRCAIEQAEATAVWALHATGSELERQYPYGIAVGLFEPFVRDPDLRRKDMFSGPAVNAEPLFAEAYLRPEAPGDPFATVHGLYWLALNAAEQGPLLLAVDDAQWADAASLRFFHYLAQRAGEVPIAMLLAFRTGEAASEDEAARALRTDRMATQLRPAALSETAVGELISASGEDSGHVGLRRACWQATGGNPFFVTELIWELRRGRLDPLARREGTVEALVEALVPESIARFIESRIARLDRRAQRFAEVVAILGEEATLRRAVALAGLSEDQATDAVRELARAAIVSGTGPLAFVHPIVGSAVYRQIPEVLRARLHRDAALLLHAGHAPVAVVAGQLQAAEPSDDAAMAAVLLEAARQALARGEAAVAIRNLMRALDEPPSPDQLPDIVLELARAEAATHDPSAVDRYNEALALIDDPLRQAQLLLELGHAQINASDWRVAAATFEKGVALMGDEASALRSQLEAGALSAAWVGMDRPDELVQRVEQMLSSRTFGPENRQLATWIAFQRGATVSSTAAATGAIVERAIDEAPIGVLVNEGQLIEVSAGLLLETDDLDGEIDLLNRALDTVERAGSFAKVGVYSYCRAWPHYYTGRLTDAIADAQAAIRASELGWEVFYPATCTVMALALIERADLDGAKDILAFDDARWAGRIDAAMLVPLARGRLHLERGDPDAALAELRMAGANCSAIGHRGQTPTEWRPWTVETLVRLGQRDEARELADEMLEIAHAWGARWPLGAAMRAAGIAQGGARGLEMHREALELLEDSSARLELTRSLVDFGAALRRHGSVGEAREVLGRGMDLAHRCGALALLERSRVELRIAGARPRRYVTRGTDALTPGEGRVAHLAAEGRTNREIAQTLFVTPKAVEFHLANAYRKLEIGSRQELSTALDSSA